MTQKQKNIMIAINVYVLVFLMNFITRVTKAYIGMAYPDVSDLAVQNLITYPSLVAMVVSFVIGPLALKASKVKLSQLAMLSMILHCVIYYVVGRLHLPFITLHLGSIACGIAIGSYIVLLNSLIADHFPPEKRGECIAKYNVFINIGDVLITYIAGWLAAGNDGANWYNAYLMGIACVVGMIGFGSMCKKAGADTPSVVSEVVKNNGSKPGIKDIPPKILVWIVLMGLVHCLFYITQNAFIINVSSYIITEYALGTSVEAGTATSLVRFALIPLTALFPVFKKYLKNWMIPVGYLVMGIGLAIMIVTKSLAGAYLCACICGLSTALVHAEFYATVSRYVPLPLVAVATSIASCIINIGTGFSANILVFCADLLGGGMENRFLVGTIISVAIAIAAAVMYVFKKPAEVE